MSVRTSSFLESGVCRIENLRLGALTRNHSVAWCQRILHHKRSIAAYFCRRELRSHNLDILLVVAIRISDDRARLLPVIRSYFGADTVPKGLA